MIALFLLVSLVPIVLVQLFTFVFYVPSISGKIRTLIDDNLRQKGQNIRLLLKGEVDLIYQIAGDPGIADSIRSLSGTEPGTVALQESRLIASFSQLSLFHAALAGVGFIGDDGRLVEYDKYLMVRSAADFNRFFPLEQIRRKVDEKGGLQFFPTTLFRDRADLPKNLFLVAFPYIDVALQSKNGYLFLLLHEAALREILNPPDGALGILTRSFLFDADGRLLSAPEEWSFEKETGANPSMLATLGARLGEFQGKERNVTLRPGPFPGWTLGTVYDESAVFADRDLIAGYTVLLGLFFLALAGAGTIWVYRNLFRSFSRLMESVRLDDTRLGIQRPRGAENEFEILGAAWSDMKARISGLVSDVNARNASLLAVAEERRLAEVRSLEAQVNPHFLYNTLNTLNWLAIDKGQPELSQALSDLADIMRYSISQIDVVATLGAELLWLSKYLSLQGLRFGANLECRIHDAGVDPGFRLYKMLFQPFVENALVHGLDPNRPGLLEICFTLTPKRRLKTVIRDNGRGFDRNLTDPPGPGASIGIANVERRLRSYYGDGATLTCESALGQGTVVELEVPEVAR